MVSFLFSVFLMIKGRSKRQFHFYFLAVVIVDLLFPRIKKEYHITSNYSFFIFILISYIFFYFFFKQSFANKLYKKIWTVIFIVFVSLTVLLQVQNDFIQFNSFTLALLPLFYIFGSMGWFAYILSQKVQGNIFDKMSFWVSCGLLIWGVFFLFRALPMYYFNTSDPQFLKDITMIFTGINSITYLLFFRSLFCKQ